MNFYLIVPIAAYSKEDESSLPSVFRMDDDGKMLCVKALSGLDLEAFDGIYFTILRCMDEKYSLSLLLELQFRRYNISNAHIIVLDSPTSSQPETVYNTIKIAGITGGIFIKDADCCFSGEVFPGNLVTIYPLEALEWVNPQHKSYVAVDDMFYVTNIIEKKIISHYFSAGGYGFEDAEDFVRYYERYAGTKGLYLSHIIYSMLLDKYTFRPVLAEDYCDFSQK